MVLAVITRDPSQSRGERHVKRNNGRRGRVKSLGDGGGGHIFNTLQACLGLCMYCVETIQTCQDRLFGAVKVGQGIGLADQGVLDLEEVVFSFHNAECEGNEIIGEATDLGVEVLFGFAVEVGEKRLKSTNV